MRPRERVLRAAAWLGRMAPLLSALALAILPILPALLVAGIVATRAGGDSPFLLQRAEQMAVALAAGHIPPRWMPDSAFGMGYPFWNFYAPLAWYVAGGIAALGGGVIGGLKVTLALSFIAAAGGAYVLARDGWRSTAAGVLGAVAYTFAPYHLVNVYVRGDALSELVAYAVFPWLLIAIDRAVAAPSPRRTVALALTAAALALAHNISALIFAPLAVAYALWRLGRPRRAHGAAPPSADGARALRAAHGGAPPSIEGARALPTANGWAARLVAWWRAQELRGWPLARHLGGPWVAVSAGAVLGALIAAYFWLPALAERGAVQLDRNLQGYFDFHGHFRGLGLLDIGPLFRYDLIDDLPARVGLVQLVAALAGAAVAWAGSARAPGRRRAIAFWGGAALVAVGMATPLSRPIWDAAPLLAFVQFPWRWLAVAALPLAMLTAALAPAVGARRPAAAWPLVVAVAIALGWSATAGLPVAGLAVRDVTRSDIWAFELLSGNVGTTVRHEYLPRGVDPPPVSGADAIAGRNAAPRAVSGILEAAIEVENAPARQAWQIEIGGSDAAQVAFPTYGFPGWTVTVDGGVPFEAGAVPGSGWLSAEIPPGSHAVVLGLERSTPRALAEALTLAALLICAALWLVERKRSGWWRVLIGVGAIVGLVMVARLMPVAPEDGPVTMDWDRAPWPHYNPGGVAFGDARLTVATIEAGAAPIEDADPPVSRAVAGETLRVALGWEDAPTGADVEVALVSAAEPAPDRAPDVYVALRDEISTPQAMELRVPVEVPPGLYLVRLLVFDLAGERVAPATAEGDALSAVYLGPVRIVAPTSAWATPASTPVLRAGDVTLHEIAAEQQGDVLLVTMTWQADRAPTVDYKTSVRLRDAAGRTLAQVDEVPLYGYSPPSSWPAGASIRDRRWLPLPADLAIDGDYHVEVVLYTAHDGAELGKGTSGRLHLEGRAKP